ncbi:hypothetical protein BU14_0654s0002 [Porphyra umbilicalis]|uniref:Uncharacterized protein n=1 Tax=Porphyra umbilicalis TaxID=2786 RepID=A0A1X6NQB0_PORUM|nr:hypothetical protein BU14_0654s0002 [Porphyra umbilicalis]|eukprot:OSX70829.1 hypothetical protein BU14_0654s0002 [Porphyra umbilicalis]
MATVVPRSPSFLPPPPSLPLRRPPAASRSTPRCGGTPPTPHSLGEFTPGGNPSTQRALLSTLGSAVATARTRDTLDELVAMPHARTQLRSTFASGAAHIRERQERAVAAAAAGDVARWAEAGRVVGGAARRQREEIERELGEVQRLLGRAERARLGGGGGGRPRPRRRGPARAPAAAAAAAVAAAALAVTPGGRRRGVGGGGGGATPSRVWCPCCACWGCWGGPPGGGGGGGSTTSAAPGGGSRSSPPCSASSRGWGGGGRPRARPKRRRGGALTAAGSRRLVAWRPGAGRPPAGRPARRAGRTWFHTGVVCGGAGATRRRVDLLYIFRLFPAAGHRVFVFSLLSTVSTRVARLVRPRDVDAAHDDGARRHGVARTAHTEPHVHGPPRRRHPRRPARGATARPPARAPAGGRRRAPTKKQNQKTPPPKKNRGGTRARPPSRARREAPARHDPTPDAAAPARRPAATVCRRAPPTDVHGGVGAPPRAPRGGRARVPNGDAAHRPPALPATAVGAATGAAPRRERWVQTDGGGGGGGGGRRRPTPRAGRPPPLGGRHARHGPHWRRPVAAAAAAAGAATAVAAPQPRRVDGRVDDSPARRQWPPSWRWPRRRWRGRTAAPRVRPPAAVARGWAPTATAPPVPSFGGGGDAAAVGAREGAFPTLRRSTAGGRESERGMRRPRRAGKGGGGGGREIAERWEERPIAPADGGTCADHLARPPSCCVRLWWLGQRTRAAPVNILYTLKQRRHHV